MFLASILRKICSSYARVFARLRLTARALGSALDSYTSHLTLCDVEFDAII